MQPSVSGPADISGARAQPSPLAESARGWQNIQLGVMGFIGFCGVLKMGSEQAGPVWLSWWSGGMSVLALIVSFFSTWMVGSVAFPTYGNEAQMPASAPGRLRGGIVMTFVSIAMMALGAVTGWWPSSAGAPKVQVSDSSGGTACGSLVDGAPSGIVWLKTDKEVLQVRLTSVATMKSVDSCG